MNQNGHEEIKNNTLLRITFKFNGYLDSDVRTYNEWLMPTINLINRLDGPVFSNINRAVYDAGLQGVPTNLYPIFYNKELKKDKRIQQYNHMYVDPYERGHVRLPNFIYCLVHYIKLFKKPIQRYIEQNLKGTHPDYPNDDGGYISYIIWGDVYSINNTYYGPQSIMDTYNNFMENIHR